MGVVLAQDVELSDRLNGLETAWGLIANVSGGDWSQQNDEWRVAARRWHDEVLVPAVSEALNPEA